ncbi:hypothetical protein IEN85_10555 [Pelagicoccus sp. NFK12]|uniref:Uncharacterized protein n=1 Tax=Pelagicoccus enzymogenes TaxID=2773457 RepID=A0A927F8R8_9BACT|nr:hypothetical protein [Pelagicoccus enzymogenes]MBD5779929.1 hypothetical protein [Pelagicoccus enzymogenes]
MEPNQSKSPMCPSCSKALLSRTATRCSWCGSVIPDELRFTDEEIERAEEELKKSSEAIDRKENERKIRDGKRSMIETAFELTIGTIINLIKKS